MFEQRVSTGYSSHDAHETDKPVSSSSSGHCTWRLEIQFEQHFIVCPMETTHFGSNTIGLSVHGVLDVNA